MKRTFIKKPVLANTQPDVVKFEVGQTYTSSGLYGERVTYEVVDRTVNTISVRESHVSEDDFSQVDDGVEEYPIVVQDMYDNDYENVIGKQEAALIWQYKGHEGYLFARDSRVGYEEGTEDNEYEDDWDDYDRDYAPSSTAGDYSPSNPWDAPGMSLRDFI